MKSDAGEDDIERGDDRIAIIGEVHDRSLIQYLPVDREQLMRRQPEFGAVDRGHGVEASRPFIWSCGRSGATTADVSSWKAQAEQGGNV